MSSGASVIPRKRLAEAERLSAPESFIVFDITQAKTWTMRCKIPK
jgi:hypothetical protein